MADRVVVIGAGPAGSAVAAALAEVGLDFVLVDPAPERRWANNYGLWLHDVAGLGLDAGLARAWDRPTVCADGRPCRTIAGVYAQVDNDALARELRGRLARHGGLVRAAAVVGVEASGTGARVQLADGDSLMAALVVDASGPLSPFVDRPAGKAAAQTAWGILARVREHPWEPGEMALMDYRSVPDPAVGMPTFLYALPIDDRHVFLEETVLAASPAVGPERLAVQLDRRLAAMGILVEAVLDTERCFIPMDAPLPRIPQPVVGFGAAAGFVHPATGYQVARSLRQAPVLARAVADAIGRDQAPRAAWEAIWPAALRRSRHLATIGLGVLMGLDGAGLGRFMDAFFSMPERHWRAYLSGTATAAEMAGAMWSFGSRAGMPLRWHILRHTGKLDTREVLPLLAPGWAVPR